MMTKDEIKRRFRGIRVSIRGAERAPHKPLLVLYMLGRCSRGKDRIVSFEDARPRLRNLLAGFRGGAREGTQLDMWNPFWFLSNDKVWQLVGVPPGLEPGKKYEKGEPKRRLTAAKKLVGGGFPEEIHRPLRSDPRFLLEVAHTVLDDHFPASLHTDILDAVGIAQGDAGAPQPPEDARGRDPEFRQKILTNYDFRCALCRQPGLHVPGPGGSIRVIGLEAAHIMWHARGGPDVDANGLALCSNHHKFFDSGAFTVGDGSDPRIVRV